MGWSGRALVEEVRRGASARKAHNVNNREQKNYCHTIVVHDVRGVRVLRRTVRRNTKCSPSPLGRRSAEVASRTAQTAHIVHNRCGSGIRQMGSLIPISDQPCTST